VVALIFNNHVRKLTYSAKFLRRRLDCDEKHTSLREIFSCIN